MKPAEVSTATGNTVLLFEDPDDPEVERPGNVTTKEDTKVKAGIDKYLRRRTGDGNAPPQAEPQEEEEEEEEEHTGITDDEDDEDSGYDVLGRGSLKAGSEALVEVINEVKKLSASGIAPEDEDVEVKQEKRP